MIPHENSQLAYDRFIENGSENVFLYLAPEEFGGHSEVAQYCLISAYQICEEDYKIINIKGDLNNDMTNNIQDVMPIIGFVINDNLSEEDFEFWLSDLDNNNSVNIQDILFLVNIILNN